MVVTPFTAAGTASAVLALSKAAWKLGISLSKLYQDTQNVDSTVKNLTGDVKSLGNECDLVYAELEEIASKSETGSPPPYDVDCRVGACLAALVEGTSRTLREMELFVQSIRGEESSFLGQTQRQRRLAKCGAQIASFRTTICRHTDTLRIALLMIKAILAHIGPCPGDRGIFKVLRRLQDMVEKLQAAWEANSESRPSQTEVTLLQCAREVLAKGTTMYEAKIAADSVAGGQGAANSNIQVAQWVNTLESIRRDQRHSDQSFMVSNDPSVFSDDEVHTTATTAASVRHGLQEGDADGVVGDGSDDDLDIDLAKAALDTGTKAFEEREWKEADSLLQEALRVLQSLPKQQREFCDVFRLQYKLAVCAYHTQEHADAEEALMSLVHQSANSDEQRGYIYDAVHLLSLLYIRMGQVERARSECEKALQARRRLLGKQDDASLESTALMAHIYALLNNRARAKSCLAMIPEARRSDVLKIVEESLGTKVEHLDSSSPLTPSIYEDSDLIAKPSRSTLYASPLEVPMENRCYGPVPAMISQLPAASTQPYHQSIPSIKTGSDMLRIRAVRSVSSTEGRSESRATSDRGVIDDHFADPQVVGAAALSPSERPGANESFRNRTLSRKEILERIGCQPRDRIEEAVCVGDTLAFASLLNKKNDFWRSKSRMRGRPERVTALHFASLFGEIDMARRLIASNFNINEVPHGYTESLTPLKFAIGARQVDMVEFLTANGAKPSLPDSWSTLAGQLMNRSWLKKTMSDAEKEYVPNRIIEIFRILLKHGWDINAPFGTSGGTVLHQAVTFWTGSYRWDLKLRAAITTFLCSRGADPFQTNTEGKTTHDMALASGHQDLLLILDQGSRGTVPYPRPAELIELSGELRSMVL